jgi:DNA repair exonuclease SbcCD ATPase subunit
MIQIKNLTVKNFMSVGNSTQAVNFDRRDLTLVLGENLDLGGDGSRNGTGKTTIINALSYALYGQALSNIRKDNLVNKTNNKNMLVGLDFVVNNQEYRIERGRKPNVLKFYVNNEQQTVTDEAQGDSRETQDAIESVLGISHDMFKHILALNTYTEPFLSLKANDQRTIIEQLLGITLLSERADSIKDQNRVTKENIQQEEFRIRAVQEANKRIEEQIEALRRRQQLWATKHEEEVNKLNTALEELKKIDIDAEIQAHKDHKVWEQRRKDINELATQISRTKLDLGREQKSVTKLESELAQLESHTCHTCGQAFHDSKHESVLESKKKDLAGAREASQEHSRILAELETTHTALGTLGKPPKMFYDAEEDAIHHRSSLAALEKQLTEKQAETDPYGEQIDEMTGKALQTVSYDPLNNSNKTTRTSGFLAQTTDQQRQFCA